MFSRGNGTRFGGRTSLGVTAGVRFWVEQAFRLALTCLSEYWGFNPWGALLTGFRQAYRFKIFLAGNPSILPVDANVQPNRTG
jgi:hypothetical protein